MYGLPQHNWTGVSHLAYVEVANGESEAELLDVETWPTRLSQTAGGFQKLWVEDLIGLQAAAAAGIYPHGQATILHMD